MSRKAADLPRKRGRPRIDGRTSTAPDNGRKGGRPPAWSQEALIAAISCLRTQAERLAGPLGEELLRMATAVEEGSFRLRGRGISRAEETPAVAPKRTSEHVVVTMRVMGGRSRQGINKASQEIAEQVLRRYRAVQGDAWDYTVTVPFTSEEELDQILTQVIPTAAREIAAKRSCTIDYSARSLDEPGRSWQATAPAHGHKRTSLKLSLQCGHSKAILKDIEGRVLSRFTLNRLGGGDYQLTMPHATDEDLEHKVAQLLEQTRSIALEQGRTIPYDLFVLDRPGRVWSGTLG